MADVRRLVALSMVPPLAQEVASQIETAVSSNEEIADIAPLPDPATATLPQVAAKVNEIIAALQS